MRKRSPAIGNAKMLAVVICAAAIGFGADGSAQARFHVLGTDAVDAIHGMRVYTLRDDEAGACFRLFVLRSDGEAAREAIPPPAATLSSDQLEKVRISHALQEATAARDEQVVQLRSRRSSTWTVEYETERERIEQDYESAVRALLPDLYPAAQIAPGWRTTGTDELNAAVRRAIAAGEAAEAAATRSTLDDQLLRILTRMNQPAMLAVSPPVACPKGK